MEWIEQIIPENSLREGRNISKFFNIGLEMNEKNSIQFFSKNEILSTFSTIDSRSASLSNRYPSSDLIKE
uniref:ORF69b n=1 Tax=Pinus koraiensis TaxID=88728 RepID=Q85X36_PINKO|nr:ORF69b [Pinus koraiensis]AAO74027.1 ORF69b [Pinus koraiensis]